MGLFTIIEKFTGESKLPEIAEAVTDRCIESVWRKVGHRASALNPQQARGCVRARAAVIVYHEAEQMLNERSEMRTSVRSRLVEMSIESVIQRIQKLSHSLQLAAESAKQAA